jgi:serine/threonine-protein kinase RsbW
MTGQTADVALVVPAIPDSIAVIRQTVSGICEALGADSRTIGDIKLAATEACTNVVLHAYAGQEPGTIELDAHVLGLGLPLIAALTTSLTIVEAEGGGTEVSMTFALRDQPTDP